MKRTKRIRRMKSHRVGPLLVAFVGLALVFDSTTSAFPGDCNGLANAFNVAIGCSDLDPAQPGYNGLRTACDRIADKYFEQGCGTLGEQCVFLEDFESGALDVVWSGPGVFVQNFDVIPDPTGRSSFVGSVVSGTLTTPFEGCLFANDITVINGGNVLGPGQTISVQFYDDGTGPCCGQLFEEQGLFMNGPIGEIEIRAHGGEVNYLYSNLGCCLDSGVARTVGWHEFKVEITATESIIFIDGILIGVNTVETFFTSAGICSRTVDGVAYFDDFKICQTSP